MGWKRGRVVRKIKEQKKYARRNTEEERRGGKAKGGERENVLEILPLVLYFVLDFEGATISAMYSKR